MNTRAMGAILGLALAGLGPLSCASSGRRGPGLPAPLSRTEILSRILVLEDRRTLDGGTLQGFMGNEDPAVRRRAVQAAGRIGDPLAVSALLPLLRDPQVEVRRATALALGLLGAGESVEALTAALADPDPPMRGRAAEALGRIGDKGSGPRIAEAFRRALPPGSGPALRIRGDDPGRADDPWIELRLQLFALARLKDGAALASAVLGPDSRPVVDWWACVWAAGRIADRRLSSILLEGTKAEDPSIRALAVRGLGELGDPAHLSVVRALLEDRDPRVILQALRAAGRLGSAGADGSMVAFHLNSPNPSLRHEALLALAALPADPRQRPRVMENVGHPDPWIRSAAWPALIAIDADDVSLVLSTIGPDSDWRVRHAVAQALARHLGAHATPLLMPMLKDSDVRVVPAVLAALARANGLASAPILADHAAHPDPAVREAAIEGLASLEKAGQERFDEAFSRAYAASPGDEGVGDRLAVVEALAAQRSEGRLGVLRRIAGTDSARVVRQRALGALGGGFSSPEETALRDADARRLIGVFLPERDALFSPRAVISTRYGRVELSLDLVDTPLTTDAFVRLARAGFYDGLAFHRVVPSFVVQGGDPRGDGFGGPGRTLRCEPGPRPFGRGAVGMALAGKDTGGSQFFITLEPQPHLDGAFTNFGQVISGMDVVEKIRPGDVMERVEIFDGRDPR